MTEASVQVRSKAEELAKRARERFRPCAHGRTPDDIERLSRFGGPIVTMTGDLEDLATRVCRVTAKLGKASKLAALVRVLCILIFLGAVGWQGYQMYLHGFAVWVEKAGDFFTTIFNREEPVQVVEALTNLFLLVVVGVFSIHRLDDLAEWARVRSAMRHMRLIASKTSVACLSLSEERLERREGLNTQSSPRIEVPTSYVEAFLRYSTEIFGVLGAMCDVLAAQTNCDGVRERLDDFRAGCDERYRRINERRQLVHALVEKDGSNPTVPPSPPCADPVPA